MMKMRPMLALLLILAMSSASAAFADRMWEPMEQGSSFEPSMDYEDYEDYEDNEDYEEYAIPAAYAMPCAHPSAPTPPPKQAIRPCHMPCPPPHYTPMAECQEPSPPPSPCCYPMLSCPPPPCITMCPPRSCWGDFYVGGNFFRLHLHANRHAACNTEKFFGDSGVQNSHKLRANLDGFTVGYERNRSNRCYQNLEFNWAVGMARPKHNRDCRNLDRYLHYYQTHFLLGYTFPFLCDNSGLFTPYAGLGYRYVDHRLVATSGSLRYRTYYVPIGVKLDCYCSEFMSIGLRGEWIIPIDASVRLSELGAVRFKLHYKNSYMIELPLTYRLRLCNTSFEFLLTPFYRHFVDGSSYRLKYRRCVYKKLPEQINNEWGGQILIGKNF